MVFHACERVPGPISIRVKRQLAHQVGAVCLNRTGLMDNTSATLVLL